MLRPVSISLLGRVSAETYTPSVIARLAALVSRRRLLCQTMSARPRQRRDKGHDLDTSLYMLPMRFRYVPTSRYYQMRATPWVDVERYRISGRYGESFGCFRIPFRGMTLVCVVSDGDYQAAGLGPEFAWEHVSVSLKNRTPNWYELQFVK